MNWKSRRLKVCIPVNTRVRNQMKRIINLLTMPALARISSPFLPRRVNCWVAATVGFEVIDCPGGSSGEPGRGNHGKKKLEITLMI